MTNKIRFLHVKEEYIKFLKGFDDKVQDNYVDSKHQKPYISGIKIEINGKQYLAPLTSYKADKYDDMEQKTIFKIIKKNKKRDDEKLAVILLNNMIPLIDGVSEVIDFNSFDEKYKNLLRQEYRCISNQESIEMINKIANTVYKEVTENKSSFFTELSCDFKKLEIASEQFAIDKISSDK